MHNSETEQESDDWWAKHVASPMHISTLAPSEPQNAEAAALAEIFGVSTTTPKRTPPGARAGRFTVRPGGHATFRDVDNPRARD